MQTMLITNPETGREVRVMAWRVDPRAVVEEFRAGRLRTARDLGWAILSDEETVCAMAETEHEESSDRNLALRVFEHALDWRLGLWTLDFIRAAARMGRMPKQFHVAADRAGRVYVIGASGKVYAEPEPQKGRRRAG